MTSIREKKTIHWGPATVWLVTHILQNNFYFQHKKETYSSLKQLERVNYGNFHFWGSVPLKFLFYCKPVGLYHLFYCPTGQNITLLYNILYISADMVGFFFYCGCYCVKIDLWITANLLWPPPAQTDKLWRSRD